MVPRRGLEPPRPKTPGPKPGASTNSATSARGENSSSNQPSCAAELRSDQQRRTLHHSTSKGSARSSFPAAWPAGLIGTGLVLTGDVVGLDLVECCHLPQEGRGDQEADENHATEDDDLLIERREFGHAVAAELAGDQTGDQVAESGAEEPHAQHLAVIAARGQLGGRRQADRAQAELACGVEQV